MDLIKMIPSVSYATELFGGEGINGYDSVLWAERYQKPGEFKIKAKLSSGLKTFLPIGTIISHIRTRELMIVETHQIQEPKDKDPTIEISGRSFITVLEQRIVGQNYVDGGGVELVNYTLATDETWEQLVFMIADHIGDGFTNDFDDCLPSVVASHSCTGIATVEERLVKYDNVLSRALEILKIDDIGIRTLRPTSSDLNIYIDIYQGADRTAEVQFSTVLGELDNIQYLFTNKKYYTHARVIGRWVQYDVEGIPAVNIDRRWMLIDGSDIDQPYPSLPTGLDLTYALAMMVVRGQEVLKNQKKITITQADVSPNSTLSYGRDYFLGDLVTVNGNFNQTQVMRVTEFVEIEDEDGTSGQPTLEIRGEDS